MNSMYSNHIENKEETSPEQFKNMFLILINRHFPAGGVSTRVR